MRKISIIIVSIFIILLISSFSINVFADTTSSNTNSNQTLDNIASQLQTPVSSSAKISFTDFMDKLLNKGYTLFNIVKKLILLILVGNGLYGVLQWSTAGTNPIPKKEGFYRIIFSIAGYFIVSYAGVIYSWFTSI